MSRRLIILFFAVCTMCFFISCVANKNSDEYNTASESSSLSENIISTEDLGEHKTEGILEDDTLPLIIYYNDTIYYLKESLFVITEEKLRYYDIADNYESIGTIDTFVKPNEHPKVNNSCNFGEESFELYKYSDDNTEFLTALWNEVQVWETEEKHNQQ